MPVLAPSSFSGYPPFGLSFDQVDTVVDLICQGVKQAIPNVKSGMMEVPITQVVRKDIKRVRKSLGLTNLEVRGEDEQDDMSTTSPGILGRIDITFKFMHQFGDEEAYVAVECKRLHESDSALNKKYVSQGAVRFTSNKYGSGHQWGFMIGYILSAQMSSIVEIIDTGIRSSPCLSCGLLPEQRHIDSLAIYSSPLTQTTGNQIMIKHILVDMTVAA